MPSWFVISHCPTCCASTRIEHWLHHRRPVHCIESADNIKRLYVGYRRLLHQYRQCRDGPDCMRDRLIVSAPSLTTVHRHPITACMTPRPPQLKRGQHNMHCRRRRLHGGSNEFGDWADCVSRRQIVRVATITALVALTISTLFVSQQPSVCSSTAGSINCITATAGYYATASIAATSQAACGPGTLCVLHMHALQSIEGV